MSRTFPQNDDLSSYILPRKLMQNKSLLKTLYHKIHSYSHLKVFRCPYFPLFPSSKFTNFQIDPHLIVVINASTCPPIKSLLVGMWFLPKFLFSKYFLRNKVLKIFWMKTYHTTLYIIYLNPLSTQARTDHLKFLINRPQNLAFAANNIISLANGLATPNNILLYIRPKHILIPFTQIKHLILPILAQIPP